MMKNGKLEGCAENKEPLKIYESPKITTGVTKKTSK